MPARPASSLRLVPTLAAILGIGGGSGCSFLFVEGPPREHAKLQRFDCTERNVLPVVDAVVAGLLGATAQGIVADPENDAETRAIAITALGSYAALGAASAIWGMHATGRCRAAQDARTARLGPGTGEAGRPLPPPYGPPAWPPLPGAPTLRASAPSSPAASPAPASPPAGTTP